MMPFEVEMWSVDISMPKFSLMYGCIWLGVAARPIAFRARRTASCLVISSAMSASPFGLE